MDENGNVLTNEGRARSVITALEAFAQHAYGGQSLNEVSDDSELESLATDLIANIMHWCDTKNISPEDVVERAERHYDAEWAEENTNG